MKTTAFGLLLLATTSDSFSTVRPQRLPTLTPTLTTTSTTALEAKKSTHVKNVAAAMVLGMAILLTPASAVLADTSLDFSLPSSYDTKMSGFGEGTEAILNTKGRADRTDPGANEKEKEAESMVKAEKARQDAKAKKRAEMKALEDESKRRSAEKKERDAERLKNIWN